MATVSAIPEFSVYVDLKDGTRVGVHKFIVDKKGPLYGNTIEWDVQRFAPGTIIGSQLGLNGQDNIRTVTNAGGANRNTASASLPVSIVDSWTSPEPDEVYFCTFHSGSANATIRTIT